MILKHIPYTREIHVTSFFKKHVPEGSRIMTDEHKVYNTLAENYDQSRVNHSMGIYVIGDKYTNSIENFWSVLKRGIYGTYVQISRKHTTRYLNEFAERHNTRKMLPFQRFEYFLEATGSRLSYKKLVS